MSPCLLSKNKGIKIYRIIMLSLVLYGYETWSACYGRVFKNGVLRKVFAPMREGVIGD